MSQEPTRPPTVPSEARWNAKNNEWELGAQNAEGKSVGEWRYWLAPEGHLVCRATLTDAGSLAEYERFHPNGELAQRGRLSGGKYLEQCWVRSSAPTSERWGASGEPENCWTAKKIIGSSPLAYEYFDREGHPLNAAGQRIDLVASKDLAKHLAREPGETAQQALERYRAFFEAAFAGVSDDKLEPYRLVVSAPPASPRDVATLEERLGVSLPPAWIGHVTTRGFFRLGGQELYTLDAVTSLLEWLALQSDCEPDEVPDLVEVPPDALRNSICFAFFDAEVVCFRYEVAAQGAPPISTLFHDDQASFAGGSSARTFDDHVSDLVDQTIRRAADQFSCRDR